MCVHLRTYPQSLLVLGMEDDTDIYYIPGLHEKYAARPASLNNLSLAGFVANYTAKFPFAADTSIEHEKVDEQICLHLPFLNVTFRKENRLMKSDTTLYLKNKTRSSTIIDYDYYASPKEIKLT